MNRHQFSHYSLAIFVLIILSLAVSPARATTPLDVVVSEVAWSGMPADPNDEWIELYNNTGSDIDLTGWRLYTADTPNITLSGVIPANGHYLLERTDDTSIPDRTADDIYTGALTNSPAEIITLTNSLSEVIDVVGRQLSGAWFAGTSTPDRRPMVRANLTAPGTLASSWETGVPGGTPLNSILDNDIDTYGYSSNIDWVPGAGTGYEAQAEDCNDANSAIYPGATEVLNHLDDDCDGQIDEGLVLGPFEWSVYFNSDLIIEAMDKTTALTPMELALLSRLDTAGSTIDVAFYGFDRQSLADALIAAHNRGVQVRIVGDDEAAAGEYAAYYDLITNAGIPVVLDTQSYIEHNKFAVFDGQVVWTGSTNWTDSCLTYNANNSVVITSTHLAEAYTTEFAEMFAGHFHNQKQDNTTHTFLFDGGYLESYFSPTDSVQAAVLDVLANAQESIYFVHFYWTDDLMGSQVVTKTLSGVDVSGVWDAVGARNAYSENDKLCAAGVPLKVEIFGGKAHDKFAVIDVNGANPIVITGSFNWTASGDEQNDENTLIIYNADVAQAYYQEYLALYNALPDATICSNHSAESGLAACGDGSDNDYDSYIDAADFDCRESTPAACTDSIDNDSDGDIDLDDLDCYRCLLTGADIQGETVIGVGEPLTVTGSILPATAPGPLTYEWSGENLVSADGLAATYEWSVAGEYTVTMTATNMCKSEIAAHRVTVTSDNHEPVAVDDNAAASVDTPVIIDVLANDWDVDNDPLHVASVTLPAHGVVANHFTSVTYTPTLSYTGIDHFSYIVSDGALTDTALVTVTVTNDNHAPVANDDLADAHVGIPVIINVLANDTDVDFDPLSVAATTQPEHGEVINNLINVSYTSTPGYIGLDHFTYIVSDGILTDTAIVTVTVTSDNHAPVAIDDAAATHVDTPATIWVLANDIDIDNDPLHVAAVTQPAHGVVDNNVGSVTYTPALGYGGLDYFTYIVSDGVLTDTAVVSVIITSVNHAPVANDDNTATHVDTLATIPVLDNDTDVDDDPLHVAAVTQPAHGAVVNNLDSVTYTPTLGYNGLDHFSYIVSDGVLTDTAMVTVTVTALPIVGFSDVAYEVDESAGFALITVTLDTASAISVTVAYSASGGTAAAGSDYLPISGVLTFEPGIVTATFTVTIIDDQLAEEGESINLILGNPAGCVLGSQSTAVLIIPKNDWMVIYLPLVKRGP